MKETENKGKSTFLKKNIPMLVCLPVMLLLLWGIASVYVLPPEFTAYAAIMIAICWGITLAIMYAADYRREREEHLQRESEMIRQNEQQELSLLRDNQDFFGMWAHQIKTPIAAMNLLLASEEVNAALCKQELFKIENYVELAMNYLRLDNMGHDLRIETYSPEPIVKQLVKKYATVFIYKHLSVELKDLDVRILTDEKWFAFALEQILTNALKYTETGKIVISAGYEDDSEGRIYLEIRDTGIGIRGEDLPRIFEKGFTGYNGRLDKKASGLGLFMCKQILDRLGHDISVISKEGEGTSVRVYVNKAQTGHSGE